MNNRGLYTVAMQIDCAGESLTLLAERAVVWPRVRVLLVADAHFGKAAAFRAKGVPVPRGTTAANLATLAHLVREHALQEVIFLGDFLHAAQSRAPATLAALADFRARYPALKLTLVRGNHDSHAGDPPAALEMDVVDEPLSRGPFALCHMPQTCTGQYVLAGHVHPGVRIATASESARMPCFWFGEHRAVLPAFGSFTGTYCITPQPKDRVYAVAGDAVLHLPAHLFASAA